MTAHEFSPRKGYASIVAYRADRPSVEIDLSDSTNQWGVAPSALAALRDWSPAIVSEYPPVESPRLARACAAYVGVAPEHVIGGCGSDNLLDAAMRALAEPGECIAHPSPSFAMIPVSARSNGLIPVGVPLLANGNVDADGMLATGARIIYLCTPNNPTGTPHSREAVERVVAGAPGVVIIDEAYAEFADDCHTAEAPTHPHVFATRTLSKCFGLAGLRVGYGVGSVPIINEVLKARGPYKVNAFAERAATAALTGDGEWIAELVVRTREVRTRFAETLRSIGLAPLHSRANFLCVPVPNALIAVERLYALGIAVRGFPGLPGIGDALRIGLAPWPVLERVAAALRSVLLL